MQSAEVTLEAYKIAAEAFRECGACCTQPLAFGDEAQMILLRRNGARSKLIDLLSQTKILAEELE